MKKLIQLLVLAALVTTFALPALAQTTPSTGTTTAASGQQDDPAVKAADYEQFTKNRTTNPAAAYEAGKAYLAKYEAKDGPDDPYVKYIKKWVGSYEKVARRTQLLQQITDKKYNEAFASAKQVLADYPDDLAILFELARAGTIAMSNGNEANNADTVNYAKRTVQLIQSGKSFDPNKPFTDKEKNEMLGKLNFALGTLQQKSAPGEAVTSFINAAQLEGPSKKDPLTYITLADIYETNDYGKLAPQFTSNCNTEEKAKTQECIDLKAKTDQVVDHIIDALARAIAYSNISPDAAKFEKARAAWMDSLTKYYKYRNDGSDTGLKELLAGITSRPLPKPGEAVAPLTPPKTSTTPSSSATPAGTTTTQPSGPAAGTPAGKTTTTPATTTPAKTGTTTPSKTQSGSKTTTTQPAGKTSTTKTTPKRSHK